LTGDNKQPIRIQHPRTEHYIYLQNKPLHCRNSNPERHYKH